jgi:prevent-host-death family protein
MVKPFETSAKSVAATPSSPGTIKTAGDFPRAKRRRGVASTLRHTSSFNFDVAMVGGGAFDRINQMDKLVGMKTKEVGAFEAKTRLSELLEQVRQGAVFFITRRGQPIAELRPVNLPERRPRFGCDKGRVILGADFDAPLPEMKDYTA